MRYTYRAIWPVFEPALPMIRLVEEAKTELPKMLMYAKAKIVGPPRWYLAASRDVPGSGRVSEWVLVLEAPAESRRVAEEQDRWFQKRHPHRERSAA